MDETLRQSCRGHINDAFSYGRNRCDRSVTTVCEIVKLRKMPISQGTWDVTSAGKIIAINGLGQIRIHSWGSRPGTDEIGAYDPIAIHPNQYESTSQWFIMTRLRFITNQYESTSQWFIMIHKSNLRACERPLNHICNDKMYPKAYRGALIDIYAIFSPCTSCLLLLATKMHFIHPFNLPKVRVKTMVINQQAFFEDD